MLAAVAATTIHLHPTSELAERVLLPGDPGRALLLAQLLLESPRMFNHHRGLWGYTGAAADGAPLTIQSTGMGGPSAAIVVEELILLGARRFVRVGTCGALAPELALGDLLVVREAIAHDGTSRALGAEGRVAASPVVTAALEAAGEGRVAAGTVLTTDLFFDPDPRHEEWRAAGALAVEMESAALLRVAERAGLEAGGVLAVSDTLVPERRRIDEDGLTAAAEHLGRVALDALPPT